MIAVAWLLSLMHLSLAKFRTGDTLLVEHVYLQDSIHMLRQSSPYTFSITWDQPQPGLNGVVLGWTGFEVPTADDYLSFYAQLTQTNQSGATIAFNPTQYGVSVVKVALEIFGFLPPSDEAVLTGRTVWQPDVLRDSARSSNIESVYFEMTSIDKYPTSDFSYLVHITCFTAYVPPGQQQHLKIASTSSHNSTHFSSTIGCDETSNIYLSITFATVILYRPLTTQYWSAYHFDFKAINDLSMFFNTTELQFSFTFAGLEPSTFNLSLCHFQQFRLGTLTGGAYKSMIVQYGNGSVFFDLFYVQRCRFNIYCWIMCDEGYGKDLRVADYACQLCYIAITSCMTCTNTSHCTLYCYDSMANCSKCTAATTCDSCYVGDIVEGGCTQVAGCIKVEQLSQGTINHTSECIECDSSEFSLVAGLCQCLHTAESIITGHCTQVIGCISTIRTDGITRCHFCNLALGFTLSSNNQCVCSEGYEIRTDRCVQICGDGLVFDLACDDGNTVSGDGCSSDCQVQLYYQCSSGSNLIASICSYSRQMTVAILSIEKDGKNKGKLILSVTPAILMVNNVNFLATSRFFVNNQHISLDDSSYSSGNITLSFSYKFTLQGHNATLNVSLDPHYFSENSTLEHYFEFEVESANDELIYESTTIFFNLMEYTFMAVSLLTILIFIISLFLHRMLGLQLLVTCQILYLMHFQVSNYTTLVGYFGSFGYCFTNYWHYLNSSSNFGLPSYHKVSYNSDNYQSSMLIIIGGLSLALFTLGLIKALKAVLPQVLWISNLTRKLNKAIVTLKVGLFLPVLILTVDQPRSSSNQGLFGTIIGSILKIFVFLIPTIGFFVFWHNSRKQPHHFKHCQPSFFYMRFFLLCTLLYGITVCLDLLFLSQQFQLLSFLVLSLILLTYQLFGSTYEHYLHRIGSLSNTVTLVVFSACLLLRKFLPDLAAQDKQSHYIALVLFCLMINVTLAVIKLVHLFYLLCSTPSKSQNTKESAPFNSSLFAIANLLVEGSPILYDTQAQGILDRQKSRQQKYFQKSVKKTIDFKAKLLGNTEQESWAQ